MEDFDKRFRKRQAEFDRDWERARKYAWVGAVVTGIIGLSLTGFFVWIIVMLMRYLGVI